MPTLKVDLQEGFTGETVIVRLNQKEVYRGAPKTRTQIGLADSRSFDLPPQQVTLEVETPQSGVVKSIELGLLHDVNVGICLLPDGAISLSESAEPFGYL